MAMERERVEQACERARVRPGAQAILILVFVDELPTSVVAERLGMTVPAVKKSLVRALKRIRDCGVEFSLPETGGEL